MQSLKHIFRNSYTLSHDKQFPVQMHRHEHSDDCRNSIGNRLCIKNTVDPPEGWQEKDDGNKADSLPACAEDKAFLRFSKRQEKGGVYSIEAEKKEGKAICPQGLLAGLNEIQVPFCKLRHNLSGKQGHHQAKYGAEDGRPQDGDPDRLMETVILLGTVAVTGNRLKSLHEAKNHQAAHGNNSCNHTHPCNYGVPVSLCLQVNQGDGQAGQQLEHQRGDSYFQYFGHNFPGKQHFLI